MKRSAACLVGLALAAAAGQPAANAASIYVATGGLDSAHSSWSTAYTNIQQALDAARSGDTIHLAGQTFALGAPVDWTGLASSVTIRGGYAATNDADAPGPSDPGRWPTLITRNPAGTNRLFSLSGVTNGSLEAVTLAGGRTAGADGAGLWAANCAGLLLASCTISNNTAVTNDSSGSVSGGGIHIAPNTSATVSNCLIRDNLATGGRYAAMSGGGINVAAGGTATVVNCVLVRNKAYNSSISANNYAQGGAACSSGALTMRNCLIARNESLHEAGVSMERGDGVYVAAGAAILENCTVAHNAGAGIQRAAGTVAATNCIAWGNVDDISGTVILVACDIRDGDSNGVAGTISAPPLFTNGYYLQAGSPCLDAGTNAVWLTAGGYTTSAGGEPDSGAVDMGYHSAAAAFDTTWNDLYVSPDGAGTNSGLTWAQAKRSIADALALARDGSRIHIASGLYTNGVETFPLRATDLAGLSLLGTNALDTIVRGPGTTNIVQAAWCPGLRIEGLTIAGGLVAGNGGGLSLQYCPDGARIASCVVSNNQTTGSARLGGGIAVTAESEVTISNCLLTANSCGTDYGCAGGGLGVGARAIVTAVETAFATNRATSSHTAVYGGGVYNGGTLTLRSCIVANNYVRYGSGNDGYERGHGLYGAGPTLLDSCTVAGNYNKGVYYASGPLTITNSIVWGNGDDIANAPVGTARLFTSNIEDGDSNGVFGCVSIDPAFADTTYYHLASRGGHYASGFFFGGFWTNSPSTNSPFIDALDGNWSREPNPNGRRRNWEGYANTPVASKTFIEEPGVFDSITVHAYEPVDPGTNSATLRGEILHAGTGATQADLFFCWGPADGGTASTGGWAHVDPMGSRAQWELVSDPVEGLGPGQYAYRCFVTNAAGEQDWSDLQQFGSVALPVVTNPGPLYVWDRRAVLRGEIVAPNGPAPAVWFRYWTAGGAETSTVPLGSQSGAFSLTVAGLTPATLYACTFTASNGAGTVEANTQAFTTLASPMTWYVATNGAATWGTNWATAFRTAQDALDIARSNDTVCLAGQRFGFDTPLVWGPAASWVAVRGGYAAAGDASLPGPADAAQWPTLLVQTGTLYARGVMQVNGVTNGMLERVTVTGGNNDGSGGGLALAGVSGFTVSSCTITNNRTGNNGYGAGIWLASGSALVSNSLIRANLAAGDNGCGGGLAVSAGARLDIVNTVLATNKAVSWHSAVRGGAIHNAGTVGMRNCLLYGNWVIYGSGNETYEDGDAIYSSGTLIAENCTIAANPNEGVQRGAGTLALTNCIVWANGDDIVGAVTLAYSDIEDGDSSGVGGCISADPLFAGPATNDFRLAEGSPCRDAGVAMPSWMSGATDLAGSPRIMGRGVEMGAYELAPSAGGTLWFVK